MIEITVCPHGVDLTSRPCALCDRRSEIASLRARVARLEGALQYITRNSCCAPCREAGLVAKQALEES